MKTFAAVCCFLLFLQFAANSQLCNGSLGDPVVNITFGSGADPGPQLAAGVTSYTYLRGDCPNDGSYTLRHVSNECFGNTWYTIPDDHTPNDVNGYYMLVNASYTPGDFFVDTVRGLCGSTTYEFAAWVMNVLRPSACSFAGIKPNLTFKIETTTGTVLASYDTKNIPEAVSVSWNQYGLFFQTLPNTSNLVVRITNNARGGCGNDLALDDITLRPCGPDVNALVVSTGTDTVDICESDNTQFLFHATYSTGYANPAFQWQLSTDNGSSWTNIPGATSTNYLRQPSLPGTYEYRMMIAESINFNSLQCRIASNNITINVNSLPNVRIGNDINACFGSNVMLVAEPGFFRYSWKGPSGFSSNNQMQMLQNIGYTAAGLYQLTVFTDKGCTASDSILIAVVPNPTASVGPAINICEGTSTVLHAEGGSRYQWIPVSHLSSDTISDPVANPTDSTLYNAIVMDEYGCTDSATIAVNVWKKPVADAGPDKSIREGVSVRLNGSIKGTDVYFIWSPPSYLDDANSLNPFANPPTSSSYRLQVTSNLGCGISLDEVFVKVFPQVIIPNAFSPNADGINDTWNIKALQVYDQSETFIYNRYGQLVYHANGYSPWDGKRNGSPLPVGMYYYVIDLKMNNEPKLTGSVLIIR